LYFLIKEKGVIPVTEQLPFGFRNLDLAVESNILLLQTQG